MEQKARRLNLPQAEADARLIGQTVLCSIGMIYDPLRKEFLERAGEGLKSSRTELVKQINMLLKGPERMDHEDPVGGFPLKRPLLHS